MSQLLIYKNLFEIKILHHYFLDKGEEVWDSMNQEDKDTMEAKYDIRNILEITPTMDCTNVLSSHNCIFKPTSGGILVGIKAKSDDVHPDEFKPYIPLSENLTFRFLIQLKDLNFLNYTALPISGNKNSMFIFKNSIINASISFPSLSTVPPVYENGTVYMPGDMLSDDAVNPTKLYTALVKTSDDPNLSEDWLSETGDIDTSLNYVNVNDSYPVESGFFHYTMKVADSYPTATMKNSSGNIVKPKMEILPGDFYTMQYDMRQFPQGFYSIHIDSSDNPVYHDDVTFYLLQQSETPFGLIEIKVKSSQAAFNLIEVDHLLSPTFEIRFRNRRTHWRYVGKIFENPYVVENPLPLTRFGYIEIVKPPEPDDTKTVMLPNPSDSLIKAEALINTNEKNYYSEIHIN